MASIGAVWLDGAVDPPVRLGGGSADAAGCIDCEGTSGMAELAAAPRLTADGCVEMFCGGTDSAECACAWLCDPLDNGGCATSDACAAAAEIKREI